MFWDIGTASASEWLGSTVTNSASHLSYPPIIGDYALKSHQFFKINQ